MWTSGQQHRQHVVSCKLPVLVLSWGAVVCGCFGLSGEWVGRRSGGWAVLGLWGFSSCCAGTRVVWFPGGLGKVLPLATWCWHLLLCGPSLGVPCCSALGTGLWLPTSCSAWQGSLGGPVFLCYLWLAVVGIRCPSLSNRHRWLKADVFDCGCFLCCCGLNLFIIAIICC